MKTFPWKQHQLWQVYLCDKIHRCQYLHHINVIHSGYNPQTPCAVTMRCRWYHIQRAAHSSRGVRADYIYIYILQNPGQSKQITGCVEYVYVCACVLWENWHYGAISEAFDGYSTKTLAHNETWMTEIDSLLCQEITSKTIIWWVGFNSGCFSTVGAVKLLYLLLVLWYA